MKIVFLIIFLIAIFFTWRDFRKKVKNVEKEVEIRPIFVRFLLALILLIIAIIVFVF
ncbi:hypothetical protein ACFVAD_20180 [Sutcliffiella sp. NPDC057660]|uniref:hypothetical protein n=1 Tax=Sutcliffiella sp. NPDC057660 TaxID=3346199 RepID=UPI003680F461